MTIEELEIQIEADAQGAAGSIDSLTKSLGGLKGATANAAGLGKVANHMKTLSSAMSGLNLGSFSSQMQQLTAGLAPLQSLGKNNLSTFVNSLKKIPDVTKSLDPSTVERFASAIQRVAAAVKPLATEMEKISMGFSALPKRIQSFITQMERSGRGATTAAKGYKAAANGLSTLNQKFNLSILYMGVMRVTNVLGDFVEKSNQYVEDMNLFTVSMGEYADAAYDYAMKAQELMGIDAGQFMRNQGYFQSIASGFGVASDQAAIMSQNLSQLGYDLASFYNSDVETAMTKLQSGLAGELEPLRRWGFALDQATLQEVALNHGIETSIRNMTQAEKSMIRYIAIMEQSTNAQGDMARTLQTPANAMRVLSQQITLLGRSIGNILIPMLSAILPWAIAAAKALRAVMDAIAAFFGFSLPTIDYDIGGDVAAGAGAAENLEDAMGGAADSAKKLKDYVLGIDELNILRPDEDTGAGGGGAGGGAGGGGFDGLELPKYDFLDGLSEQVDKLLKKVQELLPLLLLIAAAFALWKLGTWANGLSGLARVLAGLAIALAGVAIYVVSFMDAWKNGVDWLHLVGMIIGVSAAMVGLSIAISPVVGGLAGVAGGIGIMVVSIKDIIKNGPKLKNVTGLLSGLVVTGAGFVTMSKEWGELGKGFTKVFKGIGTAFTNTFDVMASFNSGGKGLIANLKNMSAATRASLSPLQQFTVGLAGAAAVGTTAFFVIKDLSLSILDGSASFGDFAKAGLILVPVITAVGTAMYVALGPLGLLITGLAAVAGAFLGFAAAQSELRAQAIEAEFFDGQGVAVGELANEFAGLMDSVTAANQPIIDGWAAIESGRAPIEGVIGSVNALTFEIDAGVTSLDEAVPEYCNLFQSLVDQTTPLLETLRDNVMYALAGSFGDSLEAAELDKQAYAELVTGLHGDTLARIEELKAENEGFFQAIESGAGLTDTEFKKMISNYNELASYTGVSTDATNELGSALERATRDIDFGNVDELNRAVGEMGGAYDIAKQSIYDNTDALEAELTQLKANAEAMGQLDRANEIQAVIDQLEPYEIAQINEIDATLAEYMNTMQANLALGAQDTWNNALNDFDSLSAVQKMFYGSPENYAAEMVKTFNSTVIEPFSEGVTEQFGSALGDTVWIDTVMDDLVDSMNKHLALKMPSGLEETMRSSISQSVSQLAPSVPGLTESLGQDFVDGFLSPIEAADVAAPAAEMVQAGLDQIPITQNSGSPSKITEGYGLDFVEGFATEGILGNIKLATDASTKLAQDSIDALTSGINDNASGPVDAFKNMLNQMLSAVGSFSSNVANTINQTISSMANAFNSTQASGRYVRAGSMSGAGVAYLDVGMDYVPYDNMPAFLHKGEAVLTADDAGIYRMLGGIEGIQTALNIAQVNTGALSINRSSAAPYPVGTQATQTTGATGASEIAAAVYEAVSAAMSERSEGDGRPIVVQIDGKELLESNIKHDQTYGYSGFRRPVVNMG